MPRKLYVSVLLVVILLAIGLYVQSAAGQRVPATAIPSPGVVFLEHRLTANGSVINGTVPFRSVDFPSYWFNANTGELHGCIDFTINGSLVMIFGDGLTMQGNYGSGTGNRLYGVYSLPVRADQATIYYADMYGTVGLFVNNRTIVLRPGQEYAYRENETVSDGNGIVRISYEHRYTDHGLIPKSGIQTKMVC